MTGRLFPAEFVFPGHPDKLCDAIADALVGEAMQRQERALVGVEVAVHRNQVFVTGRVACDDAAGIDVEGVVRHVYRSAGYGSGWYPAPEELQVRNALCVGPLEDGEAEFRDLSDDQAICVGYAVDIPQTNYLPVEQWLAGRLARRLYALRLERPDLLLGPDGKVIVLVREGEQSWSLDGFSCSLQQKVEGADVALQRAVRLALEAELAGLAGSLPGFSACLPERLTVNGAGAFEVGGPEGDNGLSGKKLVMDAYGPRVPIGGGAWSGKDFFKADRAGGLHARRVARLIVELGLAREATVTLGWFPGDREARVLDIAAAGCEGSRLERLARRMGLTLASSGGKLGRQLNCVEVARWGQFSEPERPWELLQRI
jgi:S-adenosylmethionine synthetase